jgi:hypothetical protein
LAITSQTKSGEEQTTAPLVTKTENTSLATVHMCRQLLHMIMIFRDEQVAKNQEKRKPNPGTGTANPVAVFIQGLGIL